MWKTLIFYTIHSILKAKHTKRSIPILKKSDSCFQQLYEKEDWLSTDLEAHSPTTNRILVLNSDTWKENLKLLNNATDKNQEVDSNSSPINEKIEKWEYNSGTSNSFKFSLF